MSSTTLPDFDAEYNQHEIADLQTAAQVVLRNLASAELRAKALQSMQEGLYPATILMSSDDPIECHAGYALYVHILTTFIEHGAWIYRPTPHFAPVF